MNAKMNKVDTLRELLDAMDKDNLSIRNARVLRYLYSNRAGANMTTISKEIGHTTAYSTTCIDNLEASKYVTRTTKRGDRRQIVIKLTNKGKTMIDNLASVL